MTKADRIRRMTDEELAAFLCDLFANDEHELCEECVAGKYCRDGGSGFLDWLKQEENNEVNSEAVVDFIRRRFMARQ